MFDIDVFDWIAEDYSSAIAEIVDNVSLYGDKE